MELNTQQDSSGAPPGCGLWLGWLLMSVIASGLGWKLAWLASEQVPGAVSTATIGLVYAALLGAGQALLLRGRTPGPFSWFLASLAGYGLGFVSGTMLANRIGLVEARFGLLLGAVFGASAGIFQWLALRRQVTAAFIWLPASIFAWTSAFFYFSPSSLWVGAFYGLVSGLVSGTTMMWLLYRPAS